MLVQVSALNSPNQEEDLNALLYDERLKALLPDAAEVVDFDTILSTSQGVSMGAEAILRFVIENADSISILINALIGVFSAKYQGRDVVVIVSDDSGTREYRGRAEELLKLGISAAGDSVHIAAGPSNDA